MPGWLRWPRRNKGFEWHTYVRTTVKLRREERKQKLEEIREMAAEGARQAGRQGMAAGRQGVAAGRHGIRVSGYRLGRWAGKAAGAARAMLAGIGRSAGGGFSAAARRIKGLGLQGGTWQGRGRVPVSLMPALSTRAKISVLFGLLAGLAGASSLMQVQDFGDNWAAVLAGLVALALSGVALAPWIRGIAERLPAGGGGGLARRASGIGGARALAAVAVIVAAVAVAGGGVWWWSGMAPDAAPITTASIARGVPPLPRRAPAFEAPVPEVVNGRARALSGDTLEVDGRVIRLSDMEAVERGQVCRDGRGRAWRCGERAQRILGDLVRRQAVVCRDLARSGPMALQGTCAAGGRDLAEAVVEAGYGFAEGFFFRTYGEVEDAAREARRGVWQGEVERPADFRAARWARAKARAPNGCPIKGRVTRRAKVYVLPWAPDYARVRVRQSRGERWFCSEQDAVTAGFAPAIKG